MSSLLERPACNGTLRREVVLPERRVGDLAPRRNREGVRALARRAAGMTSYPSVSLRMRCTGTTSARRSRLRGRRLGHIGRHGGRLRPTRRAGRAPPPRPLGAGGLRSTSPRRAPGEAAAPARARRPRGTRSGSATRRPCRGAGVRAAHPGRRMARGPAAQPPARAVAREPRRDGTGRPRRTRRPFPFPPPARTRERNAAPGRRPRRAPQPGQLFRGEGLEKCLLDEAEPWTMPCRPRWRPTCRAVEGRR